MNNNTKARYKTLTKADRRKSASLGYPVKDKWRTGKAKVARSAKHQ